MGQLNSKFLRVHDDLEVTNLPRNSGNVAIKPDNYIDGTETPKPSTKKASEVADQETRKCLKAKALRTLFSENYEKEKRKILDPRGGAIGRWSKIFLVTCIFSLFIDPLFLYLPEVTDQACIQNGMTLQVILTIIRSVADVFYVIQIFVRFHTAYVAPSSRVFGRGELIIDPSKVTLRYVRRGFWIDVIAALPLPQVLTWVVIPKLGGTVVTVKRNSCWFIMITQYLLRVFLTYPLPSQIVDATGVATETAWTVAACNLMLYMLSSHFSGAWYYFLAIGRQEACWRSACNIENPNCQNEYFDCRTVDDLPRINWFKSTNVTNLCSPAAGFYQYGIYGTAVTENVIGSAFLNKFFYGFWWGIQTYSSIGNDLQTSTYVGELLFTIIVVTHGLVMFALFIGRMQRYLQSTTRRVEEWRTKRTDTEQWMLHRHLPPELRQSVQQYDHYKWLASRGVDEEALLNDLPMDLRREIKRYLCLSLVRRVPLFNQMDETILDAICERLKPTLFTKRMFLVCESDPVNQMLFIIRGHLDSYTTDGGRSGFFNSCRIGSGDFCGEELLTWALDQRPHIILPSSTRTVKAITQVEAYALVAEDLKFVAAQFRRLHSKQLRHIFRFYSHQWRTWAACFIQVAWRKHKKSKEMGDLRASESEGPTQESFRSMFVKNSVESASSVVDPLQKPLELDFD